MQRCVTLLVGIVLTASAASAADLVIRNARLIDGTGAAPRQTSIEVQNGIITKIGADVEASDAPVIDAAGATVLPGLIDAHVHLVVVPGSGQRGDSQEQQRQLRRQHLRAYLACGITTVLDTGIDASTAREVQSWLASGEPGPRYLTLGPGFTTPGGYLAEYGGGIATEADAEARFAELEAIGAVGAKVFMESGFTPQIHWPIHSPEIRAAIVRGAAKRRLPIYVHANDEADKALALDMHAHAIVHTGYYASQPSDAFVQRMASSGAYLMTTFSIMDVDLMRFHLERLGDPLMRLVVPPIELQTAADPEAARYLTRMEIGFGAPWMPGILRDAAAWWLLSEKNTAGNLRSCEQAARRFAAAGVPIVMGSDSGNWPIVPYQFHGPTSVREIELLGAAGFTPAQALAAATRVPATMLGLDPEIGTIQVGKHADMIITRGDPLQDLRALRTLQWVIKDGVARAPAQWIAP